MDYLKRRRTKQEQIQTNYRQAYEEGSEELIIYRHFWEISSLIRKAASDGEDSIPLKEWLGYFDTGTGIRSKLQDKLVQGMKRELAELAYLLGFENV